MITKHTLFISFFHWEVQVIILTIVSILILSVILWRVWNVGYSRLVMCLLSVPLITCILLPLSQSPRYISLENDTIHVKKIIGSIDIPLSEIQSISEVQAEDLSNSSKIFGTGGVFGYLGKFKNKKIGSYTMYSTEEGNRIVIRTDSECYIFNCRDSKKLIAIVNAITVQH